MKIALYHNVPSGGAKRIVYEHASRLSARHQIDLYSLTCANQTFADVRPFARQSSIYPFQRSELLGKPFGRVNQAIRMREIGRLRQVMRRLAAEIDAGGYDVVLVHPCSITFSPMLLQFLRTPTLYYRHDPIRWLEPGFSRHLSAKRGLRGWLDSVDPLPGAYFRLLQREDRNSMFAASAVVTNSYFMRETLFRVYGIAPQVSRHAVDLTKFQPGNGYRRTSDFVVSVGSISPPKGYDFIIRSLGRIPEERRPRLILIGNISLPEEWTYLENLAMDEHVEIELHELIDDSELVQYYRDAICTVYAPLMEPFGLVALESMACGTPVVGVMEGGVRETILPGRTGLLSDRDPQAFASSVTQLITNPQLRASLSQQAREYVEQQWDWDGAMAILEKHLSQTAQIDQKA